MLQSKSQEFAGCGLWNCVSDRSNESKSSWAINSTRDSHPRMFLQADHWHQLLYYRYWNC